MFTARRLILITGFALAVILLATLIYATFFRAAPVPETPPGSGSGGGLPTAPPGRPTTEGPGGGRLPGGEPTAPGEEAAATPTETLVPEAASFSVADAASGSVLYYDNDSAKFRRITASGEVETLSDTAFRSVEQVTWSPERTTAVLEYPDGSNILYDFANRRQITLPRHWEDFSFGADGESLAFKSLGIDPNNRWLGVANLDGSGARAIEALGTNEGNVDVMWSPSGQVVGLLREVTGADRQEIFFIGLEGENFRSMTAPGIGFQGSWAPNGDRLLYSVASSGNAYRPQLWVADAEGETIGANRRSINLNTWAEKCTFRTSTTLLCAVPQYLPEGAGLVPGIAATTPDSLYAVDIGSGQVRALPQTTANFTAKSLSISPDGRWLFVEDATQGAIYRIEL